MFRLIQTYRVGLTAFVLFSVSIFITGLFGYQHWQRSHRQSLYSTMLTSARDVPAFKLKDTEGKIFTPEQLKGHWTWLFFGFTQCPKLCPTTMNKLAKAYQQLEAQHINNLPQVVMVSLDPDRDTLSQLKTYVQAFDPHFYGAKGKKEKVKALASQLGIAYAKIHAPHQSKQDYTIEHSGAVMVLNPEGKLQAFFNPPFSVKQLVHDHQIYIRN